MYIEERVPLAPLTTFKIGGEARYFTRAKTEGEAIEALSYARAHNLPFFILGGGSNVLIADEGFPGLVIKIDLKGVETLEEGNTVFLTAKAGELWDPLVAFTVQNGWWGFENLSGIPGTVGATPVQNVGAYGADVSDTIEWVQVLDMRSGTPKRFSNNECCFDYRDSMFKREEGKIFLVTSVRFALSKGYSPNLAYEELRRHLSKEGPTLRDIREAVLSIRGRKFPDLSTYGTAGSFFKNPMLSKDTFKTLQAVFPDIPFFDVSGDTVKIPLGWLLERLGFKGKRHGQVGVFERQALVLVNFGGARAHEILELSQEIADTVKEKTGIVIEPEIIILT